MGSWNSRHAASTVWAVSSLQCARTPFTGTGKPEPLRDPLCGWWSRRITHEHRLVYRPVEGALHIAQCRHHDQGLKSPAQTSSRTCRAAFSRNPERVNPWASA